MQGDSVVIDITVEFQALDTSLKSIVGLLSFVLTIMILKPQFNSVKYIHIKEHRLRQG